MRFVLESVDNLTVADVGAYGTLSTGVSGSSRYSEGEQWRRC